VRAWLFFAAAFLLSFERIGYLWIWHSADKFRACCAQPAINWFTAGPVEALEFLFYGFKLLQAAIFIAWCYLYGNGLLWPPSGNLFSLGLGLTLIASGQTLNVSVFYRLGRVGVFYGNKFGYKIPWSEKFPFSCMKHPQYVGALISIWGFFLVMRFPHDDWYLLPALETAYYGLGAHFER